MTSSTGDPVTVPAEEHRDDPGLAIDDGREGADELAVQEGVQLGAGRGLPVGLAGQGGKISAGRRAGGVGHVIHESTTLD